MEDDKMTTETKARAALPDSANRPKTDVPGMQKENTRTEPVLKASEDADRLDGSDETPADQLT